ncbi:unnamed protein product [Protopolystoma xenopodis]|uniref:DEP domain-containing protein n=1 Tax=Protopolystoma xenopodis TaxID=117903 RepID=A0A448WXY2_9PLAT|nr:unnamed protein product [Protopolystoma xenopodis]
MASSLPESDRCYPEPMQLTTETDLATVMRVMAQPESGLEIRDRVWLKITVPSAFIGSGICSDLVDWLFRHVEGFADRKESRKYASSLLKFGYIRHTVNKATFSEQCYYVFSETVNRESSLVYAC